MHSILKKSGFFIRIIKHGCTIIRCTLLVFEDTLNNIFCLQFTKAIADMFMTYTILIFSRGFYKTICTRVTISIHKLDALAPTSTMERKNIQKLEAQNISNENVCQVEYYDVLP